MLNDTEYNNMKRVLIADDGSYYCKCLETKLARAGFTVWRRRPEQIGDAEQNIIWQLIIIPVLDDPAPLIAIKDRLNDAPVFALCYDLLSTTLTELWRAGVYEIFPMPALLRDISSEAQEVLCRGGEPADPEICRFLRRLGFPSQNRGFYYLASSVEFCIREPRLLGRLVAGLYTRVAERYGTQAGLVERSMRHVAKLITESGAYSLLVGYPIHRPPTCHEMIAASADRYVTFREDWKVFFESM